jgi:uncharacterized protein (DUF1810 family)
MLERFVKAQEMTYAAALAELRAGPNTGSGRTFGVRAEHGVRPYLWSAEPKLA